MHTARSSSKGLALACLLTLSGCSLLRPGSDVPERPVKVDRLTVTGRYADDSDRFIAWATIRGYQSGSDAKLLPPRQWQDGFRIHLEQLEQPASAEAAAGRLTPFTRSLPIDVADLNPGFYIVNVNGSEKRLEIPERPMEDETVPGEVTGTPLEGPADDDAAASAGTNVAPTDPGTLLP